jgi:hypothetical protein
MMDAVLATIFGGGRAIRRKQDELYNEINFSVILSIYIKPSITALGQPLRMAAQTSDWGDSLNRCRRGGKRNTMVMMFVGGVVLLFDG